MGKKNGLERVELEVIAEHERRNRRRKRYTDGGRTKIAEKRRAGKRSLPPVPKNKSLSEIHEMDPDDIKFKDKRGDKRKWDTAHGGRGVEPVTWRETINAHYQTKVNDRRARVRKWEAEVTVAQKTLKNHTSKNQNTEMDIFDEDKLIAESILNLDEWDNEELIRGYRRNRNGKFGTAPKYVPREIQQEAFRRLVNRGDRKLKEAYMAAVDGLVQLAHHADSEKVRLDAQRELMNRVVGKVPDKVLVAHEEPWEGVLADSLVPVSEAVPIELYPQDDGTYALDADVIDITTAKEREGGVEAHSTPTAAVGEPVPSIVAPPPSPPRKKKAPADADEPKPERDRRKKRKKVTK